MRETNFIKQNKDKWGKFEKVLNESKKDPEELSNLFMEVTDDLSYSRTFYPNRSVRAYLNNLAQRVFYDIYRNRKSRLKKFINFWKEDVPQIVFESKIDFLISLTVFSLAVIIGVFSSVMDADFPRVVLGDDYVEMTLRNIKEGKPMSVYKDPNQTMMFFQIAFNNLRVAFICFILGLSFGVGSIFFLLFNGIMLGAFQYLFFQHGVYFDSVLTIWLHGAIEICCIIIAGAAGIHLGKGLLFPGTFTRLQGLQLASRRALMIYLTIVPLIILAAFIESYITRYSDAPYVLRAILIILSFGFMFGYFVFYPYLKAKRGFTSNLKEVELPGLPNQKLEFKKIKNNGQILAESFSFYNKQLSKIGILSAIAAFAYTAFVISTRDSIVLTDNVDFFTTFFAPDIVYKNILQIVFVKDIGVQWFLNLLIIFFFSSFILFKLTTIEDKIKKSSDYLLKTLFATLAIAVLLNLLIGYNQNFYVGIFIPPFLILCLSIVYNENINFVAAFVKSFTYMFAGFHILGAYVIMFLLCTVFLFLTTSPLLGFFNYQIMSILPFTEADAKIFDLIFNCFVTSYALFAVFPIVFVTISLAQHSCREKNEANELFEYIDKITIKKKSYGMEREEADETILS